MSRAISMNNCKTRTVSAIAVLDLANELLSRKVVSRAHLSKLFPQYTVFTGDVSILGDQAIQEARVAEEVLVSLWQVAAAETCFESIGLEIGAKVNEKAKGLLANWLSQCENIGQALDIFKQNIALLNPSENWSVEYSQDTQDCILDFHFASPFSYPRMAYERSMAALIAWGAYLCGTRIAIKQATFSFPKPSYADKLTEIFGDVISYDAPRNSICLAPETMELKLVSANAYLLDVVSQRAQKVLKSLRESSSLSEQAAQLIRSDIPFYSEIDKLAEVFHMSRATLYRKLKNDGQTYQGILDEVRKTAARSAVSSGQKIESISHDLGYKDKRSFYKAYQRWFQQRPSETKQSRTC